MILSINANRRIPIILLFADAVSVVAIFNLVSFLRGVGGGWFLWALTAPVMVNLISIHLIDGYGSRADMLSVDYTSSHLIATFFACLGTLILTFVFIPAGFELQGSRAVILLSFALIGPVTLGYRRFLYSRTVVHRGGQHIVFVGGTTDFEIFDAECKRMGTKAPRIHADTTENFAAFKSVLDDISSSRLQVEAIALKESGRDLPPEAPLSLVQLYFDGTPTYTLELFHQVYWRKIPLYRINPIWLFQEGFQIAREPVFERLKRLSDIMFSVVGLILAFPFVAAAALAIKLDDSGPVFFVQPRVGWHRRKFNLIKLRTMSVSDSQGDPYTRQGDARITRVGRFLRSARLDEFPQLWNVLRGQMSLIGPRAEWDRLVAGYEKDIPSYHFRHLVKPGITGWAQVNYRYGTGIDDTLRKLEYDLYYIRNFSFMLDASIVLKTLHVMLLRKGR